MFKFHKNLQPQQGVTATELPYPIGYTCPDQPHTRTQATIGIEVGSGDELFSQAGGKLWAGHIYFGVTQSLHADLAVSDSTHRNVLWDVAVDGFKGAAQMQLAIQQTSTGCVLSISGFVVA